MDTINTADSSWQKDVGMRMREGKPFNLLTASRDLAEALEEVKLTRGVLKYFLLGSGVGFTGGFTAARMASPACIAGITRMLATVNPEPVTKAVLAIVSAGTAAGSAYCLYRMVETLVKGKYNFRIVQQNEVGEWVIEADPVKTENEKEVMPEEPQTNPA